MTDKAGLKIVFLGTHWTFDGLPFILAALCVLFFVPKIKAILCTSYRLMIDWRLFFMNYISNKLFRVVIGLYCNLQQLVTLFALHHQV